MSKTSDDNDDLVEQICAIRTWKHTALICADVLREEQRDIEKRGTAVSHDEWIMYDRICAVRRFVLSKLRREKKREKELMALWREGGKR